MPELRKDPVVGRWVIVATERARRPGNIVQSSDYWVKRSKEDCPYCQPQENILFSLPTDQDKGRDIQVIPRRKSFFKSDLWPDAHRHGLYEIVNGFGRHELVIETPEHIANMAELDVGQIQRVLETYRIRMTVLGEDLRIQHVLAYKNYGPVAGSEMFGHTSSHVMGMPVFPFHVKEKLLGARQYFRQNKRCIYCDLIAQEKSAGARVVLENDHFMAVTPFAARFLFEVWVLPKKHHCNFIEGSQGLQQDLADILKQLLQKIHLGLDDPAYNLVIQTAPVGILRPHPSVHMETTPLGRVRWGKVKDYYHWHIEVLPRLTRVAGFEKGTGFYINSIPPEATAEYLREA